MNITFTHEIGVNHSVASTTLPVEVVKIVIKCLEELQLGIIPVPTVGICGNLKHKLIYKYFQFVKTIFDV